MIRENLKNNEYLIYDKYINLELFNGIIAFIVNTRANSKTSDILKEIEKRCIWIDKSYDASIVEKYEFKYFGELLERYEERIGGDIRDIRAIALAVGYASDLIENNMITGLQLINFLTKIEEQANNDIYLNGALYLYNSQKYIYNGNKIWDMEFTKTEDIVFALSIYYDKFSDFLNLNKNNISRLLGKDKTISVIGNIGIYVWLIKNIYPIINSDRKKDNTLLKSLIKIPTGFQKNDTKVYIELFNNGYSNEEIVYLNYLILYYKTVPKAIVIGNSVVEEKIAIEFCKVFLNSPEVQNTNIYTLIDTILYRYREFKIKCYGYSKIVEVLEKSINIVNPTTFLNTYLAFKGKLFSFDILDDKWDVLVKEMESEEYQKLFDSYLLLNSFDKDKTNKCIEKYNILTENDYIKSFYKREYGRQDIFDKLVDENIIYLKDFAIYYLESNTKFESSNLETYIRGVNRKKAFDLLKYLVRTNKYTIKEINGLGFNLSSLCEHYSYYCSLEIDRSFLNKKNKLFLFNCVEKFIFEDRPSEYLDFLELVFRYNKIKKLISKEDLRSLYDELCKINPDVYKTESMQKKYLTTEELNIIQNNKRLQKEYERIYKLFEDEKEVRDKFYNEEITTIERLSYILDHIYFQDEIKFAVKIVREYLENSISKFKVNNSEMIYLLNIMQVLIKKNEINTEDAFQIIREYMNKEEKKDENSVYESCNVND
ncbi:MAG: hypothetical protein J6M60_00325 [Clostridia bacterium]|nr:hypothetical protein [Clostridia bacterium]